MALFTPFFFILLMLDMDTPPIQFRKQMIAAESFESVGVFDVNKDQKLDLVSGAFWYEGPLFVKRHIVAQPRRFGEYYDDFSTVPMDVDGDGWIDFITGGWNDNSVNWRKNPGNGESEWQEYKIGETGNIETTRAWDIDGDGTLEIVPNNPGKPLRVFKLIVDAAGKGTGKFQAYQLWDTQGHGLGFGDINGDGRGDLVLRGLHFVVRRHHLDLLNIDRRGLQFPQVVEAQSDFHVAEREESHDVEDDRDEESHGSPPAEIVGAGQAQRG